MEEVFRKVLERIKPQSNELERLAKEKEQVINSLLSKRSLKANAVIGGSVAKGIYLRNDVDVDIFAAFSMSYASEDISMILGEALTPLKPVLVHGSRDYFHLEENSVLFEIIPVLNVKSPDEARNVTDMSIHHVKWAKMHLEKSPRLRDEIRLAKAFCKGIGVYGAESYIRGFSGHTLDILVVHYGSFSELLKAGKNWEQPVVIDINKAHSGNALKALNKAKLQSPLVIIDPVDPMRNASASLDEEKFRIFVESCNRFLKKPSEEFFVKKRFSLEKLQEKAHGKKLIVLKAKPKKGKSDVSGAKLLKSYESIAKQLKLHDFALLESGWAWDKKIDAYFWYILDTKVLSEFKEHIGPPLTAKSHANEFKQKHPDCFERSKRLIAKIRREFRKPEKLVEKMIKDDQRIHERTKSIEIVEVSG